jgi:hypothetical protein
LAGGGGGLLVGNVVCGVVCFDVRGVMFGVVVVDVAEVVISVAVDTLEIVDSVVLVEVDLPMLVVDMIVEVGDDVLA